MEKINYRPLSDRVIVEGCYDRHGISQGGIILTQNDSPTYTAKIVAVGPGQVLDNGLRIAPQVAVGDKIVLSKFTGTKIKCGDRNLTIIKENEILGVIVEDSVEEQD